METLKDYADETVETVAEGLTRGRTYRSREGRSGPDTALLKRLYPHLEAMSTQFRLEAKAVIADVVKASELDKKLCELKKLERVAEERGDIKGYRPGDPLLQVKAHLQDAYEGHEAKLRTEIAQLKEIHEGTDFKITMLDKIILLVGLLQVADSLKCHLCNVADKIPPLAKDTINSLDLTGELEPYGNCAGTSGGDICTKGTFCLKTAITYQFSINKTTVNWNTYAKYCVTRRIDNDGIPANTCYDTSVQENGYKVIVKHCYCDTDFCNGVTTKQLSVTIV